MSAMPSDPRTYHGPAVVETDDGDQIPVKAELQIEVADIGERYSWHGVITGETDHPRTLLKACGLSLATLHMPDGQTASIFTRLVEFKEPIELGIVGIGPAPFGDVGRTP
jgi:hypothetical protein